MICNFCGCIHGKGCIVCKASAAQLASPVTEGPDAVVFERRQGGETHAIPLNSKVLPFDDVHIIFDVLHAQHRDADRLWILILETLKALDVRTSYDDVRRLLVQIVRSNGARNFKITKNQESKCYECRNIASDMKFSVLHKLTLEQLQSLFNLHEEENQDIQVEQIFNSIRYLTEAMKIANKWRPSPAEITQFTELTRNFNLSFLEQWGGNDFCNYLHITTTHLPALLSKYENLLCFSCYANEKINDINNEIFFYGTNRRANTEGEDDPQMAVLLHRLRTLFNPFSHSLPKFTCPQDGQHFLSFPGLRRHITSTPHSDPDRLLAKIEEEMKQQQEEKESEIEQTEL